MTVTLDLTADMGERLAAQARERGVSLHDYLQQIVAMAANQSSEHSSMEAKNLSDLLLNSPFAGSNLDLERYRDFPRPIELE